MSQNSKNAAARAFRREGLPQAQNRPNTISKAIVVVGGSGTKPYTLQAVSGNGAPVGLEFKLFGFPVHSGSIPVNTQVAIILAGASGDPFVLEATGGGGGQGDFVVAASLGFAS